MSLSVVLASALTSSGGQFVAAYIDGEQRGKTFLAPASSAPAVANTLPVTVSTAQTSIVDSAGNSKAGGWLIKISPAAADVVNSASPQNIYVDNSAVFVIATTNNG
jgi:hypothetical protein